MRKSTVAQQLDALTALAPAFDLRAIGATLRSSNPDEALADDRFLRLQQEKTAVELRRGSLVARGRMELPRSMPEVRMLAVRDTRRLVGPAAAQEMMRGFELERHLSALEGEFGNRGAATHQMEALKRAHLHTRLANENAVVATADPQYGSTYSKISRHYHDAAFYAAFAVHNPIQGLAKAEADRVADAQNLKETLPVGAWTGVTRLHPPAGAHVPQSLVGAGPVASLTADEPPGRRTTAERGRRQGRGYSPEPRLLRKDQLSRKKGPGHGKYGE